MRALVEGAHVVGPDARRIDHDPGAHGELRGWVGRIGTHDGTVGVPAFIGGQANDRRVVGHDGSVLERGGAGQRQGQAGIVRPCVEVQEAGNEMIGAQRRQMGQRLILGDALVADADAEAAREVVEPQRNGVGAGHGLGDHAVAAEEGYEKRQGADELGCVVQKALTLGQIFVDQSELALLQVAQAPVDHFGGLRRSARGEVTLLDERDLQAPAGGIERNPGSGDPSAHHQDVEPLVGQAPQRVLTSKPVHHPSLPHEVRGSSPAWAGRRDR
jgi:hypothetical protein